jgi:hypothetical protein
MPISFPENPSVNDTFQINGRHFVWNGSKWRKRRARVEVAPPSLEVTEDFSAGGSALHVDSTNESVGIGTDAPNASDALTVGGDTTVTGNLSVSGVITVPTVSAATNDTKVATTEYVTTAISNLVGGAPSALDTLNELAAALNDDASYATTITNALALKLDSSSYTASDVLAKILTVDGASSGLDADTLDGSHASEFAASSHTHSYAATSHTHSYLPLTGGTVTGQTTFSATDGVKITGSSGGIWFDDRNGDGSKYVMYHQGNFLGIWDGVETYHRFYDDGHISITDGGDNNYIYFGPNASYGGQLYVGATTDKAGTNTAAVISTDGNLHLDAGDDKAIYLNYYTQGRPINVYGDIGSSYAISGSTLTASGNVTGSGFYASDWFRAYDEKGLYSQSYGQHFYPDAGGFYWDIDGPLRVRSGYEGGIQGYVGYHDANGFGLLHSGGNWWLNTSNNDAHLVIGGSVANNAFNSTTGRRLMFGGGDADSQGNYYIGTNLENYGGNYTKLDMFWHTGIRIAAMRQYGGIRFYGSISGSSLSDELFSIGKGGGDVRATNSMQAYAYYGHSNIAGTGNAIHTPNGIYSTGTNWLYGTILTNGSGIGSSSQYIGTIYSNSWYRTSGQHGWYSQTYGGGVYMIDSTYVRTYNGKRYYSDIDTGGYTVSGHGGMVIGGTYDKSAFNTTYARKHSIQMEVDTYWGGHHDEHTGALIWCGNMNSGAWGTAEWGVRTSNNWRSYHSGSGIRIKGTRMYASLGVETALNIHSDGAGRLGYYSSRKELKNLVSYVDKSEALSRICMLQPIDFTWKKEHRPHYDPDDELIDFNVHRGFFAEDAAAIDRTYGSWGWVYKDNESDGVGSLKMQPLTEELLRSGQTLEDAVVVAYNDKAIIADLVGAVQELSRRIEELELR